MYFTIREQASREAYRPPGPTPSLHELCVRVLAIHFDDIACAGPLETRLYEEILCHPDCLATPAAVLRLEERHPDLASKATDERYWRLRDKCDVAAAKGYAPLPVLADRVAAHRAVIESWTTASKTRPLAAALEALEKIPMTVELLARTKVGKTLARFVKRCPETDPAMPAATALLAAWKRRAGEEEEDYLRAHLGECETWKDLYVLLGTAEEKKRESVAARARARFKEVAGARRLTCELASTPPRKRRTSTAISPPRINNISNVSRPKY
ncbi:hypothetical protein CTAYLR_003702 [Chrysophaeum taylorii]|uniref:TFIIS N-terminal domain-containing protein n=1 Tax=Chrysophaeum taylorii TaxID=2483200 RepID=A0AAD7UMZ7_9STRA|nr:hypothetical protein CTAYLR_003702 [Chrysophaeum taylorii]